jgi:hypothetical protein
MSMSLVKHRDEVRTEEPISSFTLDEASTCITSTQQPESLHNYAKDSMLTIKPETSISGNEISVDFNESCRVTIDFSYCKFL